MAGTLRSDNWNEGSPSSDTTIKVLRGGSYHADESSRSSASSRVELDGVARFEKDKEIESRCKNLSDQLEALKLDITRLKAESDENFKPLLNLRAYSEENFRK